MSDTSKFENARAASEARVAVASRPAGSSAAAVAAAMQRYLGAEQYHELSGDDGDSEGGQHPADQAG